MIEQSAQHAGKQRLGIMGGTFDPIHHGHLVAASEVADLYALDEVLFVPTGQPWQKEGATVSPAEDRYLMTVIATASNPRFWVSRVDIDRGGADVHHRHAARHRRRTPRQRAVLHHRRGCAGRDPVLEGRGRALALAHFVGVTRPGYSLTDAHVPPDSVSLLEVPAMAISSSACRARVAAGRPVWYLVPDGVVQYIEKRRLYRA